MIVTAPAPFCVTAPSATISPFNVNCPALLKVTMPLPVVVMLLFTVIAPAVVKDTPVALLVSTAPVSKVVPVLVPALCVSEAAVIPADSVTFLALVITMSPRRVAPTAPLKSTVPPVPAFTVRFSTPLVVPVSVEPKVMSAPAAVVNVPSVVVSSTELPLKSTAPKSIAAPLARTVLSSVVVESVEVTPALKVFVPAPPSVTPPVFKNVAALSTTFVPPVKATL